jgi:hypothetical protein
MNELPSVKELCKLQIKDFSIYIRVFQGILLTNRL